MLTLEDIRQICGSLSQELTGISDDRLSEDVDCIVYRVDVTDCGDEVFIDRHIDVEYTFGDCYEIREKTPLFRQLIEKCSLPLAEEDMEVYLYQSDNE